MKILILLILSVIILSCDEENNSEVTSKEIVFNSPQKVDIIGYNDHIMEPFITHDGTTLLFNNLNDSQVNTNLHYATRINDSTFQYVGEIAGINTESLEGVPSMDNEGNLYFISTRNYDQTLATIFSSSFSNGEAVNVQQVSGVSKNESGWVNFDAEVSLDGKYLYLVDGRFDEYGGPYESNFVLASKSEEEFQRDETSDIFKNINTDALEYAACISSDMLELYFTRLTENSLPQIYVATRNSVNEAFHDPYKIEAITGFVEGPTISPDNQIIYYHKKENGKFTLWMVRKK